MSGSARGVRPTDLLALVSFDGQVFRNEAATWDRLCRAHKPPSVMESALEGMLSFATGRHTWISVKGQRIHALVTGRRRGGPMAWEVDTLLATDEEPTAAPGLLHQLAEEARRSGASRIFLRLAEDSPAQAQALAAGFTRYARERMFVRQESPPSSGKTLPGLRPRQDRDTLALFRLYCETTPANVRSQEAATLSQWLALRERDGCRTHEEFVLEEPTGYLSAWLRVACDRRTVRLLPLLLHPDRSGDAEAAVLAALEPLCARRTERSVVALVPEHICGYGPALEALGFEEGQAYVTLVRKLAREVEVGEGAAAFVARKGRAAITAPPLAMTYRKEAPP